MSYLLVNSLMQAAYWRARPDGMPFDDLGDCFPNLVSIGWIADGKRVIDFVRGKVPLACLDRLRDDLSRSQPFPEPAKYYCGVCRAREPVELFTSPLGFSLSSIWVPAKGCVYISPGNLVHLIYDHDYRPPHEFVEAVAKAPRVGSLAFAHAMQPSINTDLFYAMRKRWEKRGAIPCDRGKAVCRYCDTPLRTSEARQCLCCGLDWHDPKRILMRDGVVNREDLLALFA